MSIIVLEPKPDVDYRNPSIYSPTSSIIYKKKQWIWSGPKLKLKAKQEIYIILNDTGFHLKEAIKSLSLL